MRNFRSKIMEVEQADKKMQPATPMAQSTSVATEQAVEPAMSAPQEKIEPIIPAEQKDKYDKQMQTSISTMNPKVGYDKIDETIKASNSSAEHKKREEIEEKRRKRAGIFNAISDGIAALANVYFTSKGAPAVVYDENNSLIHHKDSDGIEWWYEYDENNNVILSANFAAIKEESDGIRFEYSLRSNDLKLRDEYIERLKSVIKEKCINCEYYIDDCDFESHLEKIDLDGNCYGFERKKS